MFCPWKDFAQILSSPDSIPSPIEIIVDWDKRESISPWSFYESSVLLDNNGSFSSHFKCAFNVYFRKTVGQTAKVTTIAINATGSTFILSPKSTTNGPHIAPIKPKASVIPTAVDWIYTVKDSVCIEAISVYAVAEYFDKITWKYSRNSHQTCPRNQIVLDWIKEKQ